MPVCQIPHIKLGFSPQIDATIYLLLPQYYFPQCSSYLTHGDFGHFYNSCLRPALREVIPDDPLVLQHRKYPFVDPWPIHTDSLYNTTVCIPRYCLDVFAQELFVHADTARDLVDAIFYFHVDLSKRPNLAHNLADPGARTFAFHSAFYGLRHDHIDPEEWQMIVSLQISAPQRALLWSKSEHARLVASFTCWSARHASATFEASKPEVRPHVNLLHAADLVCDLTPTNGHRSHHHHNKITSVRAVTLMDEALIRPDFLYKQLLPADLTRLNKSLARVVHTLNQLSHHVQPAIAVQLTVHTGLERAYVVMTDLMPLAPFLLQVPTTDWW